MRTVQNGPQNVSDASALVLCHCVRDKLIETLTGGGAELTSRKLSLVFPSFIGGIKFFAAVNSAHLRWKIKQKQRFIPQPRRDDMDIL